jgi:hypothetical protein
MGRIGHYGHDGQVKVSPLRGLREEKAPVFNSLAVWWFLDIFPVKIRGVETRKWGVKNLLGAVR